MGLLDLLFQTKKPPALPEGAVTIRLSGTVLRSDGKQMSETQEFASLQDELIQAATMHDAGLFDSNEVDEQGATIFLFGKDAEQLFRQIEPVLRQHPLGLHARVTARSAGPVPAERVVQLQPEGRS